VINERHLQQHQKATQATAKMVMSNKFERSRPQWRDLRCSIVTSSHFGWVDSAGANFKAPLTTLFRVLTPYHGALLIWCHNLRPSSHNFITPLLTDAAPHSEMKWDRRDSNVGIHLDSGMLRSSQNFVKQRRHRIIAESRELNRICETESAADDNVYRETLRELVKVAKAVWGKLFGEMFSCRYKRMERVWSNPILRVG